MTDSPQQFDPSAVQLSPAELQLVERIAGLPVRGSRFDRGAVVETVKAIRSLGHRIARGSSVIWLPRARNKIVRKDLIPQFEEELQQVFGSDAEFQITVSDVFRGYSLDEERSVVFGVQVASRESTGSHIVKLGRAEKVQPDVDGWQQCMLKYGMTSRILLGVEGRPLAHGRYAVIYQDAYHLFGTDPDTESPKPLEVATHWAITDSKPSARSVEQVFVQIFSELNRCLYQGADHDNVSRAREFYREQLDKGDSDSAWTRWTSDTLCGTLRRDAIWLITARDNPEKDTLPEYLDPIDYLGWAFENDHVPQTLVGRSHGDLHGRNVLVGVQRGEVEQPALFDYGELDESNLLVWDFVKLESELKSRIMPDLFYDEPARKALAAAALPVRPAVPPGAAPLRRAEQEVADRADRMEFAFQFETLLASLTHTITSRAASENPLPEDRRRQTGHPAMDKALRLFLRIRQEAAYRLGYLVDRPNKWRDEYFFALAVYGVLKAKWKLEEPQIEWSLIAGGVAAAQLCARGEIDRQRMENPPEVYPASPPGSHLVPLRWAHSLWKSKKSAEACRLLGQALEQFPNAVTLNVEYALCLAASGDRLHEATQQISPLRRLCHIFHDYEALSRLGRIYKETGDEVWKADLDHPDFESYLRTEHPARQLYKEGFKLYLEAFEFSRHYFPGINAATLALLSGERQHQKRLAEEVGKICPETSIDDSQERFWVFATEGEAALLREEPRDATRFYSTALATPQASDLGMVQSMYNQLCRLYWALGANAVRPVLALLEQKGLLENLDPGPFGNCGRS